jgi:hypothetical protein
LILAQFDDFDDIDVESTGAIEEVDNNSQWDGLSPPPTIESKKKRRSSSKIKRSKGKRRSSSLFSRSSNGLLGSEESDEFSQNIAARSDEGDDPFHSPLAQESGNSSSPMRSPNRTSSVSLHSVQTTGALLSPDKKSLFTDDPFVNQETIRDVRISLEDNLNKALHDPPPCDDSDADADVADEVDHAQPRHLFTK